MVRIEVFVTAALGLLPTALGGFNTIRGETCTRRALEYLACNAPQPSCIENVASQARAFCSSYLSLPVKSTTTKTQFNTVTRTSTRIVTSRATVIKTSTSTSVTTRTETSTSITTGATATTTAPTSYVPPETVAARRRSAPRCADLPRQKLARLPAAKLSSACRCLGITAKTKVSTRTAVASSTKTKSTTRTTTSTTTRTTLKISVSTATSTTSTTSTSGTVATETPVVDYCSITYNGGGVTPGNAVIIPPGDLSGRDCCVLCWSTPNCVAAAVGLGYCQLLVKTSPLTDAPTSAQCPLGIENYQYSDGPGTLYRGPCSPGLN